MATTISTVNESLVDDKVVSALRYILPALNAFSWGVDSAGKIKSDVVYVPIGTDPTAQSKTAGTGVTANGTLAGTSITLSNFYGAAWDATEGTLAGSLFENYWADKTAGAVYSLGKQIVDAALALVTEANFGNDTEDKLTTAPADFGQADLGLLWQKAQEKIRERNISFGMNAAYAGQLMGDSNLGLVLTTSGSSFIQTGVLPSLMGMPVWTYSAFPANAQDLGGAIFGKSAIGVAMAPPSPLADGGEGNIVERRIITEPDSGVSVLYTMWADGGGTVNGECAVLYGVAKMQDSVVRLVSA